MGSEMCIRDRLGTAELAAVGLALPLVHLVHSFTVGLIGGGRVAISHRVGADESGVARRLPGQLLLLSLVMGALSILTLPLAEPALNLLGAGPAMASHAEIFFGIRVMAAPLIFGSFALNAWFHGSGDTRTPMVGTLICNAVNMVLDPVLIFGLGPAPAMGVAGAALATNIGFLACLSWLLWSARDAVSYTHLTLPTIYSV